MKLVLVILGPTGGGKTALAIELAQRLPGGGECVCADSMQVYRGMDIGTAKPTPLQQALMPHHLLDVTDPKDDSFSVDRWLALAEDAVEEIRRRDRHPIVVGGTNLYVQALLAGMAEGPRPDPALRARLNELNPAELRARLERIDPPAAQRIHPNDRKRTVRAIEVFEKTGKRLSQMQTQWESGPSSRWSSGPASINPKSKIQNPKSLHIIGLEYPVELINQRINARVKSMIEAGLVDEVRRLHECHGLGRNAREALGYKQIIEHLEGRCDLEQAIEQIKIKTRRYAKQQRTWLRRFRFGPWPGSTWIDACDLSPQELADKALAAILDETNPV